MYVWFLFFDFFKRISSVFFIATQGGSVFSSSVGIQCRGSNFFYAKDIILVLITNNVEVLKPVLDIILISLKQIRYLLIMLFNLLIYL